MSRLSAEMKFTRKISLTAIGGTGLLGQATLKVIAPFFNVTELRRPGSAKPAGADIRYVDLFDVDALRHDVMDAEVILYFPSFSTPSVSPTDARHELQVTAIALVNVIEAAARSGKMPHFIFSSTAGAMYQNSLLANNEKTLPAPISSYGLGKQISEEILRFYARVEKISYTILRFSNLYGQQGPRTVRQGVIDRFLDDALSGRSSSVWTDGASTRDYLFVDDAARAIEQVLKHPELARNAMFNVAYGAATSMQRVLSIVDKVTEGRHQYKMDLQHFSGPAHAVIDASLFRATFPEWSDLVPIERGVELTWQRKLAAASVGPSAVQS